MNNKQAEIILSLISPLIVAVFVALMSDLAYIGLNFRKIDITDLSLGIGAAFILCIIILFLFLKFIKILKKIQ